ncbi:MliC family protein [Antarcticirhabdus aurantiaca]|uniref:MliC family protein n=1 Tax=Antarcticirhabdus aurantiaca TaxID=2606717 RepID=A0ACD4NH34_9HYPH|nr:MliC family protein [Antarcticirhabdus aurantiaca]WAJ26117.1 MliC family protein [Jeongeuplla avenae]
MTLRSACLLGGVVLLGSLGSASAADLRYTCDDGQALTAAFTTPGSGLGSVRLTFAGSQEIVLSADGGRYAYAETEFWIKGREASLTRGGVTTSCRTSE